MFATTFLATYSQKGKKDWQYKLPVITFLRIKKVAIEMCCPSSISFLLFCPIYFIELKNPPKSEDFYFTCLIRES